MQVWTPHVVFLYFTTDEITYWVTLVWRSLSMGCLCRCECLTMGCLCRCACLSMGCLCRCACLIAGCLCRCECLTMGCLCRCECLTMGCLCRCACLTRGCLCRCECLTMGCLCRSSQGSSCSCRHTGPNCPEALNSCPLQPCHTPLFVMQPKKVFECSPKSVSYAAQKISRSPKRHRTLRKTYSFRL